MIKAAETRKVTALTINAARGPTAATRIHPAPVQGFCSAERKAGSASLPQGDRLARSTAAIVACRAGPKEGAEDAPDNDKRENGSVFGAKTRPHTTSARPDLRRTISVLRGRRSAQTPDSGAITANGKATAIESAASAAEFPAIDDKCN